MNKRKEKAKARKQLAEQVATWGRYIEGMKAHGIDIAEVKRTFPTIGKELEVFNGVLYLLACNLENIAKRLDPKGVCTFAEPEPLVTIRTWSTTPN